MFKNVNVNYPKKKSEKKKTIQMLQVKEPVRKSMYDQILENLKAADRQTFIHRIIYVGSHKFEQVENLVDFFEDIVSRANKLAFSFEKLTGLLLYYEHHFIHLVEGDEDTIHGHLKIMFEEEMYKTYIEKSKFLVNMYHINQRVAPEWTAHFGEPQTLLQDVNTMLDKDTIQRYTCSCIQKMLDFTCRFNSIGCRSHKTGDLYWEDYSVDLKSYSKSYMVVSQKDVYKDKVWPIPSDNVPYNIFEKEYKKVLHFSVGDRVLQEKPSKVDWREISSIDDINT